MLENQPGITPWVFRQDDLSFSDSNTGAAGINGSWLGKCCLTLKRSWMWLSCWSSPDILGWGKKGVGGFEREFLVMAEVQSHSSGWIRCLGLRCEQVTILRLWALSTKNRNGPVLGLGQQLWCLRGGRFYFSASANSFLSFGSVAASVYVKETSVVAKHLWMALSPWEGKHKFCLSFL